MTLNDVLRRAISDREFALTPGYLAELGVEEGRRLEKWFVSAHRRRELEVVENLNPERLLALALWCHIDAHTLSDMPPEFRRRDLEEACKRFNVNVSALPGLITSTTSLFEGAGA